MNRIFTTTMTIVFTIATMAQNYYHLESKGSNAPFSNLVPQGVTFNSLLQANAGGVVNDQLSGATNIPFPFTFYGETYNSYKVSDNGYLTFDVNENVSNPNNVTLPDVNAPKAAIFAFWDDLELRHPGGSGTFAVINYTIGTTPNRIHIVKFFQLRPKGLTSGTKYLFFSIVLKEQGGFDVILEGTSGTGNFTETATIGVQNEDGTVGYTAKGTDFTFPSGATLAEMNDDDVFSFIEGVQNSYDIGVLNLNVEPAYGLNNAPYTLTGQIRNYGSETITNYELSYTINGGPPVTSSMTTNITPGAYVSFSHPTAWNPSQEGSYTIEFSTSQPNGQTDEDQMNDMQSATVDVFDRLFKRKPLYEVFTSSTCGPCRPGNVTFHNVIDNAGRSEECTYIKYQQNFPFAGDPYATAESVARRSYYGVSAIPNMQIDGGWNRNAGQFNLSVHNESIAVPSLLEINTTFQKWDASVEAQVDIEAITDIPGNHVVHVAIMETITKNNSASNGEREFEHVFKKFMTVPTGDNIGSISKGNFYSKKFLFDFQGEYVLPINGQAANYPNFAREHTIEDFNNLRVVVWVQNLSTRNVLQSEYATETNVNVDRLSSAFGVDVYPNPARGNAFIKLGLVRSSNVEITLMNTAGQVVEYLPIGKIPGGDQTFQIDTKPYQNGIYLVQIKTDEGTITKKLIVNN